MLIQFDVNMPATTNVSFFLMDGKINATNAVASQFQIQNGTIKKMTAKNTGTTLVNYDASHWYRFSMIVNVPKQKYSLTIKDLNTGTEVVTDQSFYTATLQRVSSFSFWNNKLVDMQKINVTNVKLTSLDLTLSSLAVNSGDYVPSLSFDPAVQNYTIDVPYESANVTVAPTASNMGQVSLKVGDNSVNSGSSATVPLTGLSTVVPISVTSLTYTDVARTYNLTVNKLEKSPKMTDVVAEGHDGKVQIGWKPPIDPAYQAARIYAVGSDQSLTLAATLPKGTSMATLDGLVNGTAYNYKVTAVYEYDGEGESESAAVDVSATPTQLPARQMEKLDRGLVAIQDSGHVFVSWRLLGTDPADTTFNLYRDGVKLNAVPIAGSTNYVDATGTADSSYYVRAVMGGVEQKKSETAKIWASNYLTVPLQKPADGVTTAGESYTYRANDASVGDLDGDGQYEIVLKWDPSNSKDNSQAGITGNTYVDAYKLDGTRLWRIDMGVNIRAGAHYLDLMVYDLDGDGKAEVALRTADGTVDGTGAVIGNGTADYRNGTGYVLEGPEYFSIFEGLTGRELAREAYDPPRGDVGGWGDTYGNRVDRFGAAIAYLDGQKPSLVLQRGYYTRMAIVAYNWRDGQLTKLWAFDRPNPGYGQGNHQLSVADIDADGKDEIVTGNTAIDDNGQLLWDTKLGHGDAMHLSDLNPNRLGMELWTIQEETSAPTSATMIDARTGKVLFGQPQVGADTGRGLSADIDPRYPGEEVWAIDATKSAATENNSDGFMFTSDGTKISGKIPTSNFAIWWDVDLSRELLDHTWDGTNGVPKIDKWDYANSNLVNLVKFNGTYSNNGTKGNPSLQADILGDWREEVVARTEDSTALRIYSSTAVTDYRFVTLMHDPVYRLGIAWQNTGYNQPPHLSYYLGNGMQTPPAPNMYTVPATEAPDTGSGSDGDSGSGGDQGGGNGSGGDGSGDTASGDSSSGSGQSDSSQSGITTPSPVKEGELTLTAQPDASGKAAVTIQKDDLLKAVGSQAGNVRLEVTPAAGTKEVQVDVPVQDLLKAGSVKQLVMNVGLAELTLDTDYLKPGSSNVQLQVAKVEPASLPADAAALVGNHPVYELNLKVDGEKAANLDGKVTVGFPYELQPGEDPNGIVVYYIDGSGQTQVVKNGKWNSATGKVEFKPAHFSLYAAAYVSVSFNDLSGAAWAKDSIVKLASRGIVDGVSDHAFNPNAHVTRAEFVKMLMQAFDLADATATSSLTDVQADAWYASSIAAAQKLGIVQGKADGSFGVNDEITREDMSVLIYRVSELLRVKLGGTSTGGAFADQANISPYAVKAVEQMKASGIVNGVDGGKFAPQDAANRAQAAVIIDRLFQLN
ncbi:S-layer homology domain-containing protein [Paenibacillus ferrarius]